MNRLIAAMVVAFASSPSFAQLVAPPDPQVGDLMIVTGPNILTNLPITSGRSGMPLPHCRSDESIVINIQMVPLCAKLDSIRDADR